MKKLLFTGLISGFLLASGLGENPFKLKESAYLSDYFKRAESKNFAEKLSSLTSVDCDKINALSHNDFYNLIGSATHLNTLLLSWDLDRAHNEESEVYRILKLIDQCRPVLPVVTKQQMVLYVPDEPLKEYEKKLKSRQPRCCHDFSSVIYAHEQFTFSVDNREKLQELRSQLRYKIAQRLLGAVLTVARWTGLAKK